MFLTVDKRQFKGGHDSKNTVQSVSTISERRFAKEAEKRDNTLAAIFFYSGDIFPETCFHVAVVIRNILILHATDFF